MRENLLERFERRVLTGGSPMRQRVDPIVLTVAVAVAYFLAARLSLLLMTQPGVAVFWPAAGVSSGTLIALGRTARWPVAIGVIAATTAANLTGDRNVLSSSIFALSDAGEALLVAWIVERDIGSDLSLGRLRHVVALFVAAILGTAVSGLGGTLGYKLGYNPEDPALTVWWQWVASDSIGIIAVAPLIIGFVASVRAPPLRRELTEGIVGLIAVAATAGIVIFMLPSAWWEMCVAVVLLFPVTLCVAARCQLVFASATVFIVALVVITTLTFRFGNFDDTAASLEDAIMSARITIVGTAFCALILSALFAERRQHEAVVVESETRLQQALATGAVLTFDWDLATDVVRRSNNSAVVLGLDPQQILDGKSFLARIHPDDLSRVKALWNSHDPDNPTSSIIYRFLRLDGREVWLQETSKSEFDAAGRLVRVRGLARDITEGTHANMRIAADLDAMKRLHRVGVQCARGENELSYCLDEILEAAIAIAGADQGYIQLFDQVSDTLTIGAQRGFEEPFLKYFGLVNDIWSACGAAMQSGERVLVEDVKRSEFFVEELSLAVMLDAGVRAVICVPLISGSGKLLGVVSTHFGLPHRPVERELQFLDLLVRQAADYLERRATDEQQKVLVDELRDSQDRMRAILNTVLDGVITIDDKGTIEDLNPAAARIFGYAPEELLGRNVDMLMPEPFRSEHGTYLTNYLGTGQAKLIGIGRELTGLRRNGSDFPMELAVSEITVAGRRMFVGFVHDITKRMYNAERQAILIAELDHRVKNVLARVAMLAASTRMGSRSVDKYVSSFQARIQSMAVAHSLLSESGWQNVGLGSLVGKQLAPYATGTNVAIKGEDIILGAAEIQAMAMVLHELVTNAAKYGSLSVPDGRVCITWDRVTVDAGAKLLFEWRELGGPPVASAVQSNYGTRLIRDLIPHELGGNVDLVFASDGVCCSIKFPLDRVTFDNTK